MRYSNWYCDECGSTMWPAHFSGCRQLRGLARDAHQQTALGANAGERHNTRETSGGGDKGEGQ